MIEIGLGIILIAATIPILMGAGDTLRLPVGDLFPILGFSGTAAIAITGLLLILHGRYRRAKRLYPHDATRLRSSANLIGSTALILLFALILPQMAASANILGIGGFPVGYYLAAQGSLIAVVIIAFWHAARQAALDGAQIGEQKREPHTRPAGGH